MQSPKQLAEGNITRLIIHFSGPAIIGMLVMSIYNVVDRIYIGRGVGALGLAGLTVGFPIMLLIMASTMLVGVGATALISLRLGEQKVDEAEQIMANAFVLLLVIAIMLTIVGLTFLAPLLRLFGASENVLPYAYSYMRIILLGTVFQTISFGANNFIRAEGNPKTAMITMLIGAIINIVLDPIMIFVFKFGVAGAALATIFSQAMSMTWVLTYFLSGRGHLKIRPAYFKLRFSLVKIIVSMGSPVFFQQTVSSLVIVMLNNSLLAYGGDLAISAHGVIHSILTLLMMPIFGLSQGLQPIIGYNYGAKKYGRVKKALFVAILFASGIALLGYLGVVLFPERLVQLFSEDVELVTLGAHALRLFMALLPILGFAIIGANYFQAVGKPKQALFLNLSRQIFFFLPTLLILPRYLGLNGIWLVPPVADVLSAMVTGIAVYREVRYLGKLEQLGDTDSG
ncbi:MAG: MATE family efflux transporter [Firmicutes bacterium]|nr:MATE family efflux transporter [Bacillota bacterium]